MKHIPLSAVVLAAILAASLSARADILDASPFHGFAAGLGIGTEGIGIQGTTAIIPTVLNLNVGFDSFHDSRQVSSGNVDYNAGITRQGEPITVSFFYEGAPNVALSVTGATA